MKRTVNVKATDTNGTTVELVGRIDTGTDGVLSRYEVEKLVEDLEDRLNQAMTGLRYTTFRGRHVVQGR